MPCRRPGTGHCRLLALGRAVQHSAAAPRRSTALRRAAASRCRRQSRRSSQAMPRRASERPPHWPDTPPETPPPQTPPPSCTLGPAPAPAHPPPRGGTPPEGAGVLLRGLQEVIPGWARGREPPGTRREVRLTQGWMLQRCKGRSSSSGSRWGISLLSLRTSAVDVVEASRRLQFFLK